MRRRKPRELRRQPTWRVTKIKELILETSKKQKT
jgi:hypothetical protein